MKLHSMICESCGLAFERTSMKGRPPRFCAKKCKSSANRERKKAETNAGTDEETTSWARYIPLIIRMVDDLVDRARQLQDDMAGIESLDPAGIEAMELLRQIPAFKRDLDDLTMIMVQHVRGRNLSWEAVGKTLGTSASTARTTYSPERAVRRLAQIQQRTSRSASESPAEPVQAHPQEQAAEHTLQAPIEPRLQLSRALTHLQQSSGKSVGELARATRVSSSYISRLLSGERQPTWRITEQLCLSCGGDPDHIRPLWEVARGVRPRLLTHASAAVELHSSLKGLHLAASRPSAANICAGSGSDLALEEVASFLAGEAIPDWPVVQSVVQALRGRPDEVRPLWQSSRAVVPLCTAHAASPPGGAEWP